MSELDVIRVVGETLAILATLLGGMYWMAGKFLGLLREVQQARADVLDLRGDVSEITKQMKEMNGTIRVTVERVAGLEGPRR